MLKGFYACNQRCEAVVNLFGSKLEGQPPPSTIYHYTDSSGLLGILESGKFRLTDLLSLNDPTELRHSVNHAYEMLASAAAAASAHPATKVFADRFKALGERSVEEAAHFFVTCFSRDGDDLGQWRAYADNGNGFAIGFDGARLETGFVMPQRKKIGGKATFPITYDDSALRAIHQKLIDETLPLIELPNGRGLHNSDIHEYMKRLSVGLAVSVLRAATFFKHEAYTAEKEYRYLDLRAMHDPIDDVKHAARRHSLIRFTEFDWKTGYRDALREIVIGPAANEAAAAAFANNCLRAGGLQPEKVEILKSKIPYRSA
jgi:hypothetical protein